jgi:hypothetical protein
VGAWGNSGVWDNTPIVNNGSISAKVNSPRVDFVIVNIKSSIGRIIYIVYSYIRQPIGKSKIPSIVN